MAAEIETITILKVGTEEAVKSVGDLKNNIKILKELLPPRDRHRPIHR